MIFSRGSQGLGRDRHTGDQAGSANRADNGIGVAHLLQDFQGHGALSGDDVGVVETVDIGEAFAGHEPVGMGARLRKVQAGHDHARPEPPAGAHLDQGRILRHDHRHGHAEKPAMIGKTERMIASRSRYHSNFFLPRSQAEQGVPGAAFLERAGALQVVEFAKDPRSGHLGQRY